MAMLLQTENRRMYSWWWDSHISPKNSKWLQENLTDMDVKVKAMIKVIEEDADSFARRAEMYYKKRPELMKLVEEFYRAYRALAERYDHATGALRQAQRTMAEAFPNQIPFALPEDSPSSSSATEGEPHTPVMPPPIRAFFEPDDLPKDALGQSSQFHSIRRSGAYTEETDALASKKGLKQVNEMFASAEGMGHPKFAEGRVRKGLHFEEEGEVPEHKTLNGSRGIQEHELGEKEDAYEKIRRLQEEISQLSSENQNLNIQVKSESEHADKAETKVQMLQEALSKSEVEMKAMLFQYQKSLEKISNLEMDMSHSQEGCRKLNDEMLITDMKLDSAERRCLLLEKENQTQKLQLGALVQKTDEQQQELQQKHGEVEKLQISMQNEQTRYMQSEVALRSLEKLHSESLEKLRNSALEIQSVVEKLKDMELRKCDLEEDIQQVREVNITLNIELKEKQEELEKLNISIQDEHLLSLQAEEDLQSLKKLHSQSKEEVRVLMLDVESRVEMLKDMELRKQGLEEEVQQIKEENEKLNQEKLSSSLLISDFQDEIVDLKETQVKIENEVGIHLEAKKALQQELCCLKEELNDLSQKHQSVMEQIESVGLCKESLQASVKELWDGNLELKELCQKHEDEKGLLLDRLKKLENIAEKNVVLDMSLSDANAEIESLREKVKAVEELRESLSDKNSALISENGTLVFQLETVMQSMEKLSENNTFLENTLSDANIELEGFKGQLKSLEASCLSLYSENSNLQAEKNMLATQVESIETTFENLKKGYADLEDKHWYLDMEKETTLLLVSELQNLLNLTRQEHELSVQSHVTQLAAMEDSIRHLQEEGYFRDEEFKEEQHKVLEAQIENFVLKRSLYDLVEKNLALTKESQKHLEASMFSKKLISELEQENTAQKKKADLLSKHNKKLEEGVQMVSRSLKLSEDYVYSDGDEDEPYWQYVMGKIQEIHDSITDAQDENQKLLLEKSVNIVLLRQLGLDVAGLQSERSALKEELETITEELLLLQGEKDDILQMNKQLRNDIHVGCLREYKQKAEIKILDQQFLEMKDDYQNLQNEIFKAQVENFILKRSLYDLMEKNLSLAKESQKHLEASIFAEKLISELEQENLGQKKSADFLSEHNKKLKEGIQMVSMSLRLSEDYGYSDGDENELYWQLVLGRIQEIHDSIIDVQDENQKLLLEKSIYIILLRQLGSDVAGLKSERSVLKEELETSAEELLLLQGEKHDILQINRQLRDDVHAGYLREDKQQAEMKILDQQSSEMKENYQNSQNEVFKAQVENFILKRSLYDLMEKNLNLAKESQKHLEASIFSEKLISELEQENMGQKKKADFLSEHSKKLREGIQMVSRSLKLDGDYGYFNGDEDEQHWQQLILGKSQEIQDSIMDAQDENQELLLERSVDIVLLRQLGLDLVGQKSQRSALNEELETRAEKLLLLQREKHDILQMNRQLREDVHAGCLREDEQKAEIKILDQLFSEMKENYQSSQNEVFKAQVENFILKRSLYDLMEKNLNLAKESQKHLEASMFADRLISELEQENLCQKRRADFLSEHNKKLREGIQMISRCLKLSEDYGCSDDVEPHWPIILGKIQEIQGSTMDAQDENQKLLHEKSVNIILLRQLGLEVTGLKSERNALNKELEATAEELLLLQGEKHSILHMNKQLSEDVHSGHLKEDEQKAQMEILDRQLLEMKEGYQNAQNEICKLINENLSLSEKLSKSREEINMLEEANSATFTEAMTLSSLSLVFEKFNDERAMDLKMICDDFNSLCGVNNDLEKKVMEMAEKIGLIEPENVLLKGSAGKLKECLSHMVILQYDLNMANYAIEEMNCQIEQLNHHIEAGKTLLNQKNSELEKANGKFEVTENENIKLHRDLEGVRMDLDDAVGVKKELEKNIFVLMEDDKVKNKEIAKIIEENMMLSTEVYNLQNEIGVLRISEEHLTSELKYEMKRYEEEVAMLCKDIQISTIHAAIFEERILEMIGECESLDISAMIQRRMFREEILSGNIYIDELNLKLDGLEGENRRVKAELNAYLPIVLSLQDCIDSLEECTLSLIMHRQSNKQEAQDEHEHVKSYQQLSEDTSKTVPTGAVELQKLKARVEALCRVVEESGRLLMQESFNVSAKSGTLKMEIKGFIPERGVDQDDVQTSKNIIMQLKEEGEQPGKDLELRQDNAENTKGKYGLMMKDIQLDHVSSSLPCEGGGGSYRMGRVENVEIDDQMLELWETAERDCNNQMKQTPSIDTEDAIECHQIEPMEEEKSEYPSSELVAEKELGVDKQERPQKIRESHQQWSKRILKRLASDAQRLSVLQISVQELKKKIEKSEKGDHSMSPKYDTIKGELKEAEEAISHLVDINCKLTKKAEEYPASYANEVEEQEGIANQWRKQIYERARRGSDKIGRLELELQKIQYILLKLEEEREHRSKASMGRSRVLLRDYLYGRREGYRQKKGHFCGCIRPKTRGD